MGNATREGISRGDPVEATSAAATRKRYIPATIRPWPKKAESLRTRTNCQSSRARHHSASHVRNADRLGPQVPFPSGNRDITSLQRTDRHVGNEATLTPRSNCPQQGCAGVDAESARRSQSRVDLVQIATSRPRSPQSPTRGSALLCALEPNAAEQHRQRTIVGAGSRCDLGCLLARGARKDHPHRLGLHRTICACRASHRKVVDA
jgi:hypothetical protein